MRRSIGTVLQGTILVCAFHGTLAGTIAAQEMRVVGAPPADLNTSGTAERYAAPDAVTVTLQVETRGASALEARAANEAALRSVRAALAQIRGASATTVGYRVGTPPRYLSDRGDSTRPYSATTIVRVKPDRMEDAALVIDLGLRAGATGATLRYESSATNRLRNEAIAEAAEAARAEADVLARAMGGSLGPLTWTGIDRSGGAIGGLAARVIEDPELPMPPTDIVVRVTVNGRWRFITNAP